MAKQFFESNKRYIKFFAVFYLIAVFVLNWSQISWAINFKFLTNTVESFFAEKGNLFDSGKKIEDVNKPS